MSGIEMGAYELILYALLHDVGKPIQRFAKRYVENIERGDVAEATKVLVENLTRKSIAELSKTRHDDISRWVINWITGHAPSKKARELIKQILSRADPLAAAERGYEVIYRECVDKLVEARLLERISRKLSSIRMKTIRYDYHITPLLSPLWMLLMTDYLRYVGPEAYARGEAGKWTAEEATKVLQEKLSRLLDSIEECNIDSIEEETTRLLDTLLDKEVWLPVKPLTPINLRDLRTLRYLEAIKESSYGSVVGELLKMLKIARDIYLSKGRGISRSTIDTLLAVLKSTLLLVPSSVFSSIASDISLYSHSKVVAAYVASEIIGGVSDKYRLLVIDTNRIQQFISAPIKAAAASRILRGRSLLIELVLDSLLHYILESFGGLPLTNILVSEGGTIEVIVPDKNIKDTVEKIRGVADKLSSNELSYGLGFTIAYSNVFNSSKGFFIHALRKRRGFIEVLDSLTYSLAIEKARKGVRGGILVAEDKIEGFDALTKETVTKDQRFKVKVSEYNKEYVDAIAGPDKLAPEDILSETTHLSLIAGSCARNLVAVIGIHTYKIKEINQPVDPFKEGVEKIVDIISRNICKLKTGSQLLCTMDVEKLRWSIGVIPLQSSGSVYILLSLTKPEPYDPSRNEDLSSSWTFIYFILKQGLATVLEELAGLPNTKIYLEFKLVNATTGFMPSPDLAGRIYNELVEIIGRLLKKGVEVSFNYMLTNTYHPAKLKVEKTRGEEKEEIRLVDLDEYGIIALAKMDCDLMGEVRRLLSLSPSRLSTLSDVLNMVLAGKTYLQVISVAKDLQEEELLLDVIPLYAGGDDISMYGRWSHVVKFAYDVYRSLRNVIKPLTLSLAIVIDRDDTPLLELYERTISFLEDYAKKVKASGVIGEPSPRIIRTSYGASIKLDVMPIEEPSIDYPWPRDEAGKWGVNMLAKILDPSTNYVLRFEELKQDLYILLNIGAEVQKFIETYGEFNRSLHDIVRLELAYAYIWTRRSDGLKKVKELLNGLDKELGSTILVFPDETTDKGIREALRRLLSVKPLLDYIVLAIRRKDTIKPTRLKEE